MNGAAFFLRFLSLASRLWMGVAWAAGLALAGCVQPDGSFPGPAKLFSKERRADPGPGSPYCRVWLSDRWKERSADYTKIVVAPVNADYFTESSPWIRDQSIDVRKAIRRDAHALAHGMEAKIKDAAESRADGRLRVVNFRGRNTVFAEFAIVELAPPEVWWEAGASEAGFVRPGGGMPLAERGGGTLAIEGRLTDAITREVLVTLSERMVVQSNSPPGAGAGYWHGHADAMTGAWAGRMVDLCRGSQDVGVAERDPIPLKPW